MIVRRTNIQDIPALRALIDNAYRGEGAKKGWTHEADLLAGQRIDMDMLADILQDPQQVLLVVENDDGLAGCVCVANKGDHAYVGLLTVAPTLQGRGTGRKLATAAEAVVEAWGLRRIQMTVIPLRHELVAWYERLGYRDTGVRQPFPTEDRRFGVPLRSDLEFTVLEKCLQ